MRTLHIALLTLCLAGLSAQGQFPGLQFLVGTSIEDASGNTWAYLRWQAPDPQVLVDQRTAIFRKDGGANSAALFELQGLCQLNLQPATIKVLLDRGARIGDDLAVFEADLDRLFDNVGLDAGLKLAEKVSALIHVAKSDPAVYSTLTFFSQAHPAMGLCLGQAFAVEIDGVNAGTFEARRCPDTLVNPGLDCHRVVGRVTIDPSAVPRLPPPGAPVEVVEASAKGHLSVRLRWSTPDDLRRRNLLQFGFTLYRVEQAFAEANGWDQTPPPDAFSNYDPAFVQSVSDLPILPNPNLTEAEATDTNDTQTLFVIDDNQVFNGGQAFQNGDAFYYFATARDILGRDGESSAGTLVTLCDRIPPDPPRNVQVRNVRNADAPNPFNRQRLEISWDPISPERGEVPVSYGVFRWDNARGPASATNDTLALQHLVSPPILHTNSTQRLRFVDAGLGAPNPVTGLGKTWWYTVRALDDGACGGNVGPDSAPAFGVLRDRSGPDAPGGSLRILCSTPATSFVPPVEAFPDPFDGNEAQDPTLHVQADCNADPNRVEWVQFSYGPVGNPTNHSPRIYMGARTNVDFTFAIERDPPGSGVLSRVVHCRAGGVGGGVSSWSGANVFTLAPGPFLYAVHFDASAGLENVPVSPECRVHFANDPGDENERPHVNPTHIDIALTPGTEEWRVYRRIDGGALSLMEQGFDDFPTTPVISLVDTNLPANAALVCYYAQLVDRHGNPSPMTRIDCIETSSRIPMPKPLLNPLESEGTATNQQMRIRWFCSPEPVEYFEVWVKALGARRQDTTSDATINPRPAKTVFYQQSTWQQYETRRIGPAYQAGPDFDYALHLSPGWQYIVQVRGINRVGEAGPFSEPESLVWTPPGVGPVQEVPWPARPLPPVEADAIPKVTATMKNFGEGTRMPAIRIGEYISNNPDVNVGAEYNGSEGPNQRSSAFELNITPGEGALSFYTALDEKPVFPCVVYRYQVPNGFFPEVSGDVYQVTPMIRESTSFEKAGFVLKVWDPFLDVAPLVNSPPGQFGLFIQDTQPVLRNASYKYLIVRFKDNGEMDKVMPTNTFTAQ